MNGCTVRINAPLADAPRASYGAHFRHLSAFEGTVLANAKQIPLQVYLQLSIYQQYTKVVNWGTAVGRFAHSRRANFIRPPFFQYAVIPLTKESKVHDLCLDADRLAGL
jgi:hypothetical protein